MQIKVGDIVKFKPDPLKYGSLKVVQINGDSATCIYYHFGSNGKGESGAILLQTTLPLQNLGILVKKHK